MAGQQPDQPDQPTRLTDRNAESVRRIKAQMGYLDLIQAALARKMHRDTKWVSRHLAFDSSRFSELSINDLCEFAVALGVTPDKLLPRLDSNQQPFDCRPNTSSQGPNSTSQSPSTPQSNVVQLSSRRRRDAGRVAATR